MCKTEILLQFIHGGGMGQQHSTSQTPLDDSSNIHGHSNSVGDSFVVIEPTLISPIIPNKICSCRVVVSTLSYKNCNLDFSYSKKVP